MTSDTNKHQEFLSWLKKTMREVEGRDSDELPQYFAAARSSLRIQLTLTLHYYSRTS